MGTDRFTIYQKTIAKEFAFLKKTTKLEDLFAKGLELPVNGGMVVPFSMLNEDDKDLVVEIAKWHHSASIKFPQDAPSETFLVEELLKENQSSQESIIFLVLDKHGQRVGYFAFGNCFNTEYGIEVTHVIASTVAAQKVMSEAITVTLRWAQTTLFPDQIFVRIPANNKTIENLFRDLFFVEQSETTNDLTKMVLQPAPETVGKSMILTAGPSISAREANYALRAAKYGWNDQWSYYLKEFERNFAEYLGVKYAMATSSCTGALHIALAALGIGPGDEVIVPDITWVATANAVLYVGATPIFSDIDPKHWCMSASSFESLITERTKAVMPVHLYGHPAPMDEIVMIARKHNLYIIEDAAPSMGAECYGKRTGTFGDFAAFSFQGAKVTVTGEGGMLLTNDDELYKKAFTIWDQGRVPGTFWINQNGLKYKMSNIQAALGLGQIERIDELVEAKRRIFTWYAEGLAGVSQIELNHEMPWARSIYWMSSLLLSKDAKLTRDQLREQLKQRNVDTRSVFPAISQYPIWPKPQATQPVARFIGDQAINLPSGVCLNRAQVDYVCRCIREILV